MKYFLFIITFLFITIQHADAQDEWWKRDSKKSTADRSMDTLQKKKSELNKRIDTVKYRRRVTNEVHKDTFFLKEEPTSFEPGKVNVSKPSSIDKIIDFKSSTISPYSGPIMDGYRIQLFFDQDRKAVDKARSDVLKTDNKMPTYIEYKAPNYYLYVGDYRTKLDAEKERSDLLSDFPTAIVKSAKIYLPKLKERQEKKETE